MLYMLERHMHYIMNYSFKKKQNFVSIDVIISLFLGLLIFIYHYKNIIVFTSPVHLH